MTFNHRYWRKFHNRSYFNKNVRATTQNNFFVFFRPDCAFWCPTWHTLFLFLQLSCCVYSRVAKQTKYKNARFYVFVWLLLTAHSSYYQVFIGFAACFKLFKNGFWAEHKSRWNHVKDYFDLTLRCVSFKSHLRYLNCEAAGAMTSPTWVTSRPRRSRTCDAWWQCARSQRTIVGRKARVREITFSLRRCNAVSPGPM